MARGKHKRAKMGQDRAKLIEAITHARAELAYELSLLDSARDRAQESAAARADLTEATAERDRACAREVDRAREAVAVVGSLMGELRAQHRSAQKAWERYTEGFFTSGQLDPKEALLTLITGDPEAMMGDGVQRRGLDHDGAAAIQRARGDRVGGAREATAEQKSIREETIALLRLPQTGADAGSRAQVRLRVLPLPLVDFATVGDGGQAQRLGVVGSEGTAIDSPGMPVQIPPYPSHVLTAAVRDSLAGSVGAVELVEAWARSVDQLMDEVMPKTQIQSQVGLPMYPIPSDAVALKGWYSFGGWGRWIRDPDQIGIEHRRVTVAAAAAVPFWLPPGHTRAYLDSEPLAAADVDDIRLPYPSTMLAFADPIRLEAPRAVGEADSELATRLTWLGEAARTMAIDGVTIEELTNLLSLATCGFSRPVLDIATVLQFWDARIEGVVLLGDALGRVDDLFGWCMAVTSPSGNVLARLLVPARLSHTEWRDQVLNLAAVVAWADWHEPQEVRAEDAGRSARSGADAVPSSDLENAVRILNVRATRSAASESASASVGGTVAPHIRRGHWRRQRYGSKRSLIKRVRIAPTLVNAAHGDMASRVYVLPSSRQ
ncbi:hypothetical protein [Gordonia malaquae]|uniref:hypothetical protein n=1 Tax=Gordonia malaquae TaxID=410332 RepID=UPI003018B6CA